MATTGDATRRPTTLGGRTTTAAPTGRDPSNLPAPSRTARMATTGDATRRPTTLGGRPAAPTRRDPPNLPTTATPSPTRVRAARPSTDARRASTGGEASTRRPARTPIRDRPTAARPTTEARRTTTTDGLPTNGRATRRGSLPTTAAARIRRASIGSRRGTTGKIIGRTAPAAGDRRRGGRPTTRATERAALRAPAGRRSTRRAGRPAAPPRARRARLGSS